MARATGVEIRETAVRIADLEGSPRKYKILGATEVPIEPDEDGERSQDAVLAALKTAFKTAKAKKEAVVLGLPANQATIREIVIPFTDVEQIKKVIKFESESHIPGATIEDVIVDFHKIGEMGPRSRVLIIAVSKKTLQGYIDLLGRIGVDPMQIDLDAAALFSLALLDPELAGDEDEDENACHVLLDVGLVSTTVMVTQGEHLRMVRCMRMGAASLTRNLSHDLGIDAADAESVTRELLESDRPFSTAGELQSSEPGTAMTAVELKKDIINDTQRAFARRLISEIRRSLSSVQLDRKLTGIWLTGPASTAPGLETALGEAFGTPVHQLDTLSAADHKLPDRANLMVGVPSGLALKLLDHDPIGLNFRQEEFKFAHRFERIKWLIILGTGLLFVLLAFLCISEFMAQKAEKRKLRSLVQEGQKIYQKNYVNLAKNSKRLRILFPAEDEMTKERVTADARRLMSAPLDKQISRMLASLRIPMEHIKESYGIDVAEEGGSGPQDEAVSAMRRLDQFLNVFKTSGAALGRYTIDRLEVSSVNIRWNMTVEKSDWNATFEAAFKRIPGYKDYRPGSIQTVGNGLLKHDNCMLEFESER